MNTLPSKFMLWDVTTDKQVSTEESTRWALKHFKEKYEQVPVAIECHQEHFTLLSNAFKNLIVVVGTQMPTATHIRVFGSKDPVHPDQRGGLYDEN